MKVEFKFEPNQKVETIFGDVGVVSSCSINEAASIEYYVRWSTGQQWFMEDQLKGVKS